MATHPVNIRFDNDLYKEMKGLAKYPLSTAYHIQEACRQYLKQFDKPVVKTEIVPVEKKKPAKRFTPPTQQEAGNYFLEKGSMDAVNEADKFIDFYASKGWMVGKNGMKDWKAAIRNWMKGSKKQAGEPIPTLSSKMGDRSWAKGIVKDL